jgi:hypothetical protein
MWIVITAMSFVAPQDPTAQLQAGQEQPCLLNPADASLILAKHELTDCIGRRRHLNCRSALEENVHEVCHLQKDSFLKVSSIRVSKSFVQLPFVKWS